MKSVLRKKLLQHFPVPQFLEMPSVGLDISDFSVKFIEFVRDGSNLKLGRFGEYPLPSGAVVSGNIKKPDVLTETLTKLRREQDINFVRASLPEEKGYLFETEVPSVEIGEIRGSLEFKLEENVPLEPGSAVFDYDLVDDPKNKRRKSMELVVSAFAADDVQSYIDPIHESGLVPLSLEIEAQAIARSVIPQGDEKTYMVIDVGRSRSGVSIVSKGVVRFTATVDTGGDDFTKAIQLHYPESDKEEVTRIKNDEGLAKSQKSSELRDLLTEQVAILRDEMNKYMTYWLRHKTGGSKVKAKTGEKHIDSVFMCGGNANLAGLPEYLAGTLHIPVTRADVWVNSLSLENYVPDISFNHSLGFAPAIGLALHGKVQ